MEIDWRLVFTGVALLAFNGPILFAALQIRRVPELGEKVGQALQEKDAAGDPTDATSYSRVTGAIGAVMVGSLFWVVSNIVIVEAILRPHNVGELLGSIGKLFLVGAALFLPYAFNQLKSVLQ